MSSNRRAMRNDRTIFFATFKRPYYLCGRRNYRCNGRPGRSANSFLESQNPDKDISMYINSPGGSVTAGLAIYDTMQYVKSDIQTICLGQAASMGAILLAGGTKKKRFALPSSRIMIHQPWGGAQGQAADIAIQAKEIIRLKN